MVTAAIMTAINLNAQSGYDDTKHEIGAETVCGFIEVGVDEQCMSTSSKSLKLIKIIKKQPLSDIFCPQIVSRIFFFLIFASKF
jgi:hypothetical protein